MKRLPPGPDQPMSSMRILVYSALTWPIILATSPLLSFLPGFYSQSLGLPLSTVGLAIVIGRIADILSDISVGYLSDNTKSRFGRRRPWVVLGTPFFLVTLWRLYRPPPTVTGTELIVLMVAFFWCWTVVYIPYLSQGSEMTTDDRSRNRINAMQGFFLSSSGIAAALLAFLLVDGKTLAIRRATARFLGTLDLAFLSPAIAFLQRGADTGVAPYGTVLTITAVITVVVMPIGLILYMFFVPDRPRSAALSEHVSFSSVFRNRVFHRLLFGNFLIQAGVFWCVALQPFYVSFVLHAPDLVLLLFLAPQAIALLLTPLWPRLIDRTGRGAALAILALIPMTGTILMFFLQPGSPQPILAVFIFSNAAFPALIMLPYSVGADAAEYCRWKTNKDSMGIHLSMVSLVLKLSLLMTGSALWLASVFGFDPSHNDNSAGALLALRILTTLVPGAFIGAGCLVMLRFPITKRRQAAIRIRLARRNRDQVASSV